MRGDDNYLQFSYMPMSKIREVKRLLDNGWVTMKVFIANEASIRHRSRAAIYMRIWRGLYPGLVIKRFNPRVVLIKRLHYTIESNP